MTPKNCYTKIQYKSKKTECGEDFESVEKIEH